VSSSEHSPGDVEREDIEAALEVRRELGPAYEREVVDTFVDRIERAVAARVDSRLAEERARRRHSSDRDSKQLALGIVTMSLGIPISAITLTNGPEATRLIVFLTAWVGMVGVNMAYAWQSRRGPR
jgi:hypothetical protein